MTGEEEVSESHGADPDHLISVFRFQALWKSLQNIGYNMLVVRSFVQNSAVLSKLFHEVIIISIMYSLEKSLCHSPELG